MVRYASSGVFLFSKPLRHFDSVLLCYCYEPPAHQFIALLVIPALFVVQAGNVPEFSVQRIRIHIVIEFALDLPLALELCERSLPQRRSCPSGVVSDLLHGRRPRFGGGQAPLQNRLPADPLRMHPLDRLGVPGAFINGMNVCCQVPDFLVAAMIA